MMPTSHYLAVGALLFTIGTVGVVLRRNAITMFLCVELMLNGVNLTVVALARSLDQVQGQVFVLLIIAVAVAEAALGLAIVLLLAHRKKTLDVDQMDLLKW